MSANGSRGTEATFDAYAPFERCDLANGHPDRDRARNRERTHRMTVVAREAITLRFPDGSWEYCTTEEFPRLATVLCEQVLRGSSSA